MSFPVRTCEEPPLNPSAEDLVVLVDEDDVPVGTAEKLQAHREGLLHRAFSVFIFNSRGELLLQRRASGKYHSGGLWSNTCCSHPRPGESVPEAARRRLREEMGLSCSLTPLFRFTYRAEFGNGLVEHEVDHVLVGTLDGEPHPDPAEADAWRWISLPALQRDLARRPGAYTVWLRTCLPTVLQHLG